MDANAKQNLLWDLLSDKSVRIRTPKGARSYSNVDLYFDKVVIAGIPYRDRVWANNTFMAIKGLQSNEWLQNSSKRAFGTIDDIQRGLQLSQIKVSILQAINRIRCRRVIDEYGNCKSSKIYLLIPHGEEGEEILDGICTEMPLLRLHEWKFIWNDIVSNVDRTNFKEAITRLMENAHSG